MEDLPQDILDLYNSLHQRGFNFQTRNARYRKAVCQLYQLQWMSVAGNGNCFFESVCILLRDLRINHELTSDVLRANVIDYFRSCLDSTQDLCERVRVEMEDELNCELSCSNHKLFNGRRLNGYVPTTVDEYLDASSHDGVWVQGIHWLRAISFLFEVRVGVLIYGQPIVRFFGSGSVTIFLYKVCLTSLHQLHISPPSPQFDAEMHYEPLLQHSPSSTATQASQCTLPQSNVDTVPPSPAATPAQCTFPQSNTAVIISSDESSSSNFQTAASNIPGECALLRIAEYTSSYICSAPLCKNAREHFWPGRW